MAGRYEEDNGDIVMSFVGDALVGRRLNPHRERDFLAVGDLLRQADVTVANAETLFHDYEGTPVADSGPYGTYVACPPEAIADLRALGVDMVSTANNHCVDYGETGVLANIAHLRRYGMPFAGTGATLTEAVAPTFLDTAKGSVALVAVTITMPPGDHRAGEPRGVIKGRPGANVVRHSARHTVPGHAFAALREIGANLPTGRRFRDGAAELQLFGQTYALGDDYRTDHTLHPDDLALNLGWIRHARAQADWVVVSVHCHEGGATRDDPAPFAREFARLAAEAGADVVFGHGPHLDRGIEIHDGTPILHALGNFVLHNELIRHQPWDLAARFGLPPTATTADIYAERARRFAGGLAEDPVSFRSAAATVSFRAGAVAEIRLHPLDLGLGAPVTRRGRPLLARGQVAQDVLARFQLLSKPFGTTVDIDGDTGVIKL
jgi:poly-gamma-glutamate capsule biosynthesis protein CapA/YwtB (metallophosphatase superfamily)